MLRAHMVIPSPLRLSRYFQLGLADESRSRSGRRRRRAANPSGKNIAPTAANVAEVTRPEVGEVSIDQPTTRRLNTTRTTVQ